MTHALELKPLLAAAVIGAALFWLFTSEPIWKGALVGAGVQVGVRLAGVS